MQSKIAKNTIDLKNLKPAKRYSKALLECSDPDIYKSLEFVLDTVNNNPELSSFFNNPVISKQDKKDVLLEVFKGRVSDYTVNFLCLLVEENRLCILDDILLSLKNDINETENILQADIISAVELNETQKEAIISKLKEKTGKNILPGYATDSGILGGMIIKINDTVIDFSLKTRIDNLNNIIER